MYPPTSNINVTKDNNNTKMIKRILKYLDVTTISISNAFEEWINIDNVIIKIDSTLNFKFFIYKLKPIRKKEKPNICLK